MTDIASDNLSNLLSWATSKGAQISPSIEFQNTPDRGISAFKSNKNSSTSLEDTNSNSNTSNDNEYQIQVPEEIIITPSSVQQFFQSHGQQLSDFAKAKYISPNSLTKLYLAYAKFGSSSNNSNNSGETSNVEPLDYSPYIDSLPIGPSMPPSPLLWPSESKRHLAGTNLGTSIDPKMLIIINEWFDVVSALAKAIGADAKQKNDGAIVSVQQINNDLQFYRDYFLDKGELSHLGYLHLTQFEKKLAKLTNSSSTKDESGNDDTISWTSFEAYLWGHLMMTSRAFPYHILDNEKAKSGEAILIPVLDLLNHKSNEKVEWTCNTNSTSQSSSQCHNGRYFCLKINSFEQKQQGDELFNNYGCKNNEELLLGYGFMIPDNLYDTCALKLKLPLARIQEIQTAYQNLKLPVPSDYSSGSDEPASLEEKYQDGLLYFLSNENLIPEELLSLFSILVSNDYDQYYIKEHSSDDDDHDDDGFDSTAKPAITTRMQLLGINNLQAAIESKLAALEQNAVKVGPDASFYEKTAHQYKTSQQKIFNGAVKYLKKITKSTLKDMEKNGQVLTIRKILNKDPQFLKALESIFENENIIDIILGNDGSELTDELIEQVIVLWLTRCGYKNLYPEYKNATGDFDNVLPSYIFDLFLWFKINKIQGFQMEKSELDYYQSVHDQYFPMAQKLCPEVFGVGAWRKLDLIVASRIFDLIRYSRLGKNDLFLIENSMVN